MSKTIYSVAVHSSNKQKHPELKNKPITSYMFFDTYRCPSKADAEAIVHLLQKGEHASDFWVRDECDTCRMREEFCHIVCGNSI